ncbi:conserved unknown protein [Ectocarpus siliculosus]|uniref:Chromatin modification-related protein MEAF6 n=1 Tax=Ectocarpus siliculosus TaxID=2880 RepID=D7FUV8_ECTSI|nr:conserved unknown protein [Ectocarpus siliculosus]|eukprot:CBJ31764.1 conserved unknown protein [Ectocarpus siliculosus]
MAKEAAAKGSAASVDVRPSETPKDLKKRVRGLDKSLTSVHERLVQTEKQIFDLERSYLEETRLYGNVLQGWDAYLDTKGKGVADGGKGEAAAGGRGGGNKREAASEGEEGEGANKRAKGVELEERLFSLGSVTSPAAKGLQKLEDARRRAGSGSGGGSGGGGASASGGGAAPKTPKEKKSSAKRGSTKSSSKKDTSKKRRR